MTKEIDREENGFDWIDEFIIDWQKNKHNEYKQQMNKGEFDANKIIRKYIIKHMPK